MSKAKVRFLNVRPIQSADLSFNLSGIIDFRHPSLAQLGTRLKKFDASTIYEQLNAESNIINGRFVFDSEKIRNTLVDDIQTVLFAVRNRSVESSLLHAICRHQNAFLQRYKHTTEIVKEYTDLYPPADKPDSKLGQLSSLRQRAKERHDELKNAYETTAGRDGVVTTTNTGTGGESRADSQSSSDTVTESKAHATSTNKTTSTAKSKEESSSNQTGSSDASTKQRPLAYRTVNQTSRYRNKDIATGPVTHRIDSEDSESQPLKFVGSKWVPLQVNDVSFESQKTSSSNIAETTAKGESTTSAESDATGKSDSTTESKSQQAGKNATETFFSQKADTILTEFRHPNAENDLRWNRRELDLQDERLAHTLFSLQVPEMSTVLDNELTMLNQEVRQLQLNYMHTFLTPSISGLVTAIYKDMGEFVAVGEPVMRIDDDLEILLIGAVSHRAPLSVGLQVAIKIRNPYEHGGSSIELDGHIAAVRGHAADNDEWEIIIRADNTIAGDPDARRLPLNYTVQREDVELTIG